MTVLIRICGVGLLCGVTALLLKKQSPLFSALLSAAGVLLIFSFLLLRYAELLTPLTEAMSEHGLGTYGAVMLKALGVGLIVHLSGGVCRDLGENTLADGIELAGKIEILLLCLPLMGQVLALLEELLI